MGLKLAVRTLERLSAQVSPWVDGFRQTQAAPCPQEEAALLVATVDCKGVPQTRAKPASSKAGKRRTKGEKKTKKKMACVGAVYSIEPFVRSQDQVLDEVQRKA